METEPGGDKLEEATVPGRGQKRPPSPALLGATRRRTRRCPPATTTVGTSVRRRSRRKKKRNDDEEYRDTATSRAKKSKTKDDQGMSPEVRAMVVEMKKLNVHMENMNAIMQGYWDSWRKDKEDKKAQKRMMVDHITKLARECGATEANHQLWVGVLRITKDEVAISFFLASSPIGRMVVIKDFAKKDVESATLVQSDDDDDDDDEFEEFLSFFLECDVSVCIYFMYACAYAMHIDKVEGQGVRAMVGEMNVFKVHMENRNAIRQGYWDSRRMDKEDNKAEKMMVDHITKLARECGATEVNHQLWVGVLKITKDEDAINFFLASNPEGNGHH